MNLFIDNTYIPVINQAGANLVSILTFAEVLTDVRPDEDEIFNFLDREHSLEVEDMDDESSIANVDGDDNLFVATSVLNELFEDLYGNEYEDVLQRVISNMASNTTGTVNLTARGLVVVQEVKEEQASLPLNDVLGIFDASSLATIEVGANEPRTYGSLIVAGTNITVHQGNIPLYDVNRLNSVIYLRETNQEWLVHNLIMFRAHIRPEDLIVLDGAIYLSLSVIKLLASQVFSVGEGSNLLVEILTAYEQEGSLNVDFLGRRI